jgi:putative transcriptional regulator
LYVAGRCKLRELLSEINMAQQELANRTGIQKQHISEYINDKRKMSLSTAKTIASELNRSIDDLYEWIYIER